MGILKPPTESKAADVKGNDPGIRIKKLYFIYGYIGDKEHRCGKEYMK